MIKRPNKYIMGLVVSTALLSNAYAMPDDNIDEPEQNIEEGTGAKTNNGETEDDIARRSLRESLAYTEAIYNDATIGDGYGMHPLSAGDAIYTAIIDARMIADDENAVASQLNAARDVLIEKTNIFLNSKYDDEYYRQQLQSKITEAIDVFNTTTTGFEVGEYPKAARDNLEIAIVSSEFILNNTEVGYDVIVEATNSLKAELEAFHSKVIIEVDKTPLIEKLEEMKYYLSSVTVGNRPNQYLEEDKNNLDTLITELSNNLGTFTHAEMINGIESLNSAKNTLETNKVKYESINRVDITRFMVEATALLKSSEPGTEVGNFPQEYIDNLAEKLNNAISVADEYYSSQYEIDGVANALNIAIQDLKNSMITLSKEDKEELVSFIAYAEYLLTNTPVGNNTHEISEANKEKLSNVLKFAKSVEESAYSTMEDVKASSIELSNAINAFEENIIKPTDKSSLLSEIEKAKEVRDSISSAKIGDEVGMYPLSAKNKLDKAISGAMNVYESKTSTQTEIDLKTNELSKEVETFLNSIIKEKIDKSVLATLVAETKSLLKNAIAGDGEGMYAKKAYDNLKEALKDSENMIESNSVPQDIIDIQVSRLSGLMKTFINSENRSYEEAKEDLRAVYDTAKDLYDSSKEGAGLGDYPKAARSAFKEAISDANAILEGSSKSSTIFKETSKQLEKAMEAYKKSSIQVDTVEKNRLEMQDTLTKMSKMIKTTNIGSVNGGVPEYRKVALSIMYSKVKTQSESANNISEMNSVIQIAKNTISDFEDGSLHLDNDNKVNGRKLTGVVDPKSTKAINSEISVNRDIFIPQAGLPIDVKTAMPILGGMFAAIGVFLRRKSK